ncbi:MAG TPA: PQQ-binding-like beta-propeller repeat protein [Bryobacteraceae bacterium]
MNKISFAVLTGLLGSCLANAQIHPISWDAWGGGPQRSGWEKTDIRLAKDNAKDIQLLWKRKLDNGPIGKRELLPPIVLGNLISYQGFKELAMVAGSSGNIWAIDADLNRVFWKRHLDTVTSIDPTPDCPGGLTSAPALMPPRSIFGGGPYHRPKPGAIRQAPIYAVSNDGMLHRLNPSTGDDLYPAVSFLPANAKASSLAAFDDVLYTTTSGSCNGAPNAVWAIDMSGNPEKVSGKVASFVTKGGEPVGLGGPVVAGDGTVYVQTSDGKVDALTAKTLQPKGYFEIPSGAADVTPAVLDFQAHQLIVSASKDGRLYLLNSQSFAGEHTADLDRTQPLSSDGISGAFATWIDPDSGTHWIFASVEGSVEGANAPHGAIVAFQVEEQNGRPALKRAWVAPMDSPVPPVITKGIVFALATGPQSHATLYALDATTGKQLYSTGDQVTAPGDATGITVANGRVYFATTDNTVWQFGIFLEH